MDERNTVPSGPKSLRFYGSVFRLRKASLPHNGFNHILPYGFDHTLPNGDDLPGWQPNLAPENAWRRQVQRQYQAFWEAFRKFHHQLCRFHLTSLTCQVPWPPVAARGVSLLGGTGLLYRLSAINFRERPRKKDYEGLMWLGGGSQVQQEIPCDWADARGNCQKAEIGWCTIAGPGWSTSSSSYFSGELCGLAAVMEGKPPIFEQPCPFYALNGIWIALKIRNN